MREVVIVAGVRTPVGRYMGSLKDLQPYDLAAIVMREVVRRAGIQPELVDQVIMGQSYQNGEYVNIARMGLLNADWPQNIPGLTLDSRCCTGLEVVRCAAAMIASQQAEIVVAGGAESMSNAEFYLPGSIKWGLRGGKGAPKGHGDLSIWGVPFYDRIQRARVMSQPEKRYGILPTMMSWAETGAQEHAITREQCDQWAVESHRKACKAVDTGKFVEEIVPVTIPQAKGEAIVVDRDETPRPNTTLEVLSRLKPVIGGVCTAGNSSTENDGAAAVLMTSLSKAAELGLKPLAFVKSCVSVGDDPRRTYRTVPIAVNRALQKANLKLQAVDLIEIQEAFAAQVLADLAEMGLGPETYNKVNVNGSGISLGHPIACTGTRVLVTLLHEMKRRNVRYALETICGGGGLGIAAVLENYGVQE
ncbi:MAG: thiolase family protein [Desulfomonilaceae bacterium]